MPATDRILLTGATGFLGSHLCHALLGRGCEVTVLVRNSRSQNPRTRMDEALKRVGAARRLTENLPGTLHVVEGDISKPGLGMAASSYRGLVEQVEEVWHAAASLSFLEEDRDEIFQMNVDGTRQVLDLAAKVGRRRLHHISTAYVAGKRTGLLSPDDIDVGQVFKNPYEESKCRAEALIRTAEAEGHIVASVYRPSIVIGHSVTGIATHFHGVYAFIRGLWTLTRRLRRQVPDSEFLELPLRILGSEASTLNFVPIDYVTDAIIAISSRTLSRGRSFHMTDPRPTENRLWLSVVCDQLKVRGIELVGEESFVDKPMTRFESLFHRQMTFYAPYLTQEPRFDSTVTEGILADTRTRCPEVTEKFARKMTGWYIDLLNRNSRADS